LGGGGFPILIAIITMFFTSNSILSAIILTAVILLGIIMTFAVSRLLSATLLKGIPSNFTLELPPYRKPQIIKTIVRSIFDRTLFVLGRAVIVAIPAGLIIWLSANIKINNASILYYFSNFLNPFGRFIGLDGVILMAFILGFPANEIVMPIILMAYLCEGSLVEYSNLNELKGILIDNGWTLITAINVMIFSLMHFPCSTTLLTIKKETKSIKWTLLSAAIPTVIGIAMCFIIKIVLTPFL